MPGGVMERLRDNSKNGFSQSFINCFKMHNPGGFLRDKACPPPIWQNISGHLATDPAKWKQVSADCLMTQQGEVNSEHQGSRFTECKKP